MSNEIVKKVNSKWGLNEEQIEIVKNTICKDATNEELNYFLEVAKATGLNPFLKEIWFYKQPKYFIDSKGNRIKSNEHEIVIFAGRDGFLKKANEHPAFDGLESKVIEDEKGNIKGAVAKVYRKDRSIPTEVYVDFKEYYKGNSIWKAKPKTMIVKVAEAQALKKAFSITGLYSYEEFGGESIEDIRNNEKDEQKTDVKTAEKIFKSLPQEEVKEILNKNGVKTLTELPLSVSQNILNELEKEKNNLQNNEQNNTQNDKQNNEQKKYEYEVRINWGESVWEVLKKDGNAIIAIYKVDKNLKTCTCPSQKHPCKHIQMIEEIKKDSIKYNEILKKYPQQSKPKQEFDTDLKKEADLIMEEKGYCEAILWYLNKKFAMKTISAMRFLLDKFNITAKEFNNDNAKVINAYVKLFEAKESEANKK